MGRININLMGPVEVALEGVTVTGFESDKVRALLAYLVAESNRPHRRDVLAGLLWPDCTEESARASLRRALANLRKAIGDHSADPPFLLISWQTIQFNQASKAWCDVLAFGKLVEGRDLSAVPVEQLEDGIALFRGIFLEGFYVTGSPAFEEWVLLRRERLQRQAMAVLDRLTIHYQACECPEKALHYAWRQVEMEPWREEAHRGLMRLLACYGQRGAALAQYETCRMVLDKELGVEPSPETVQLYEEISGRRGNSPEKRMTSSRKHDPEDLLPRRIERGNRDGLSGGEGSSPGLTDMRLRGAALPVPEIPSPGVRAGQQLSLRRLFGFGMVLPAVISLIWLLLRATNQSGAELFSWKPTPIPVRHIFQEIDPVPPISKLAFICEGLPDPEICVREPGSNTLSQLTRNGKYRAISGHSWSPDGKQLVFAAVKKETETSRLYLINHDRSGERFLTAEDFFALTPAWSPNGEWIAFIHAGALWLVRPDGSDAHEAAAGAPYPYPVLMLGWSRDSRQIAFFKYREQGGEVISEIWAVQVNGKNLRLLRSFEGVVYGNLGWSLDGSRIACQCLFERPGERPTERSFLFNTDGSGDLQLLPGPPDNLFTSYWPQWAGEK